MCWRISPQSPGLGPTPPEIKTLIDDLWTSWPERHAAKLQSVTMPEPHLTALSQSECHLYRPRPFLAKERAELGSELNGAAREGISLGCPLGTFKELNCSHGVKSRSHAEVIAEAEQAFAAARRLVDEQSAIVQRLERTGGCNSEAVDLLNNLRELLAARERRLARVRSWPSWDNAA